MRYESLSLAVCDVGADSVESADSTESGGRLKIEDPWETSSRNLQCSIRPPIQLNGADSTESGGPKPSSSRRPEEYPIDKGLYTENQEEPKICEVTNENVA